MKLNNLSSLLIRYILIILLGLGNLFIFYFIATKPTLYFSKTILSLFHEGVSSINNLILLPNIQISLIPACIAGSAYYLLTILNLSSPMKIKTRINSILFLFITFFIVNVIRIFIFSELAISGSSYFNITHKAVWYFGSTLFVVILWFINIKLFKIKSVPFITDIRLILRPFNSPSSRIRK